VQHQDKHPKQDFLIERIAFFSDAVFAIAITLMVIDIHPPVLQRGDGSTIVWRKLGEKLPELLGLAVSFLLIGVTWMRHHQLFAYITKYDTKLMVVNLCLLFTIILFPFSTGFLFNSLFDNITTKPQVFFYLAVPLFSNLILFLMFRLAKKKYLEHPADHAFNKAIYEQGFLMLSFVLALSWVLILPMAYHPFAYIFLGLGPILSLFYKKSKKVTERTPG
jgi:uncharacterized membrane protein